MSWRAIRSGLFATVMLPSVVVLMPAHAQTGRLCEFFSRSDPLVGDADQVGQMDGGPLSSADLDNDGGLPLDNIQLVCTIQVGALGAIHAGSDYFQLTSQPLQTWTVLPPTTIRFPELPSGAPVYLCSAAVVKEFSSTNPAHHYWDSTERRWSSSNSVDCQLAISQELLFGLTAYAAFALCPTDVQCP